jgi:hypothetical protein
VTWTWAAATCRGTSHVKNGSRCQDASRTLLLGGEDDPILLVASDGAGSTDFGGQGAVLICRTLTQLAREHFSQTAYLPDDETVLAWLDAIRDRITVAAADRAASMRDFAATLVAAIICRDAALFLHVGDGAIVVEVGGAWQIGSWPASGEYASMTYFVTDGSGPQLRLTRLDQAPTSIALLTDGLERLVLDFATREPHGSFFESMIAPVRKSGVAGRDHKLSAALHRYLDSEAINARTDDDKTLILASRT